MCYNIIKEMKLIRERGDFVVNKDKNKVKSWATTVLALVIVMFLGLGVLGLQYYSVKNSNKELNSKIAELETDKKRLENENLSQGGALSEVDQKLSELESKINSQNSVIGELEEENKELKNQVSELKVMKAEGKNENTSKDLAYYKSKNTGPKVCYLTFDDGPSENTLKVLNVLKTGNAKATFFVMGTKKIEYLKNIKNDGHAIGLHTNTHEWKLYKTEKTYFADLNAIRKKVKKQTGEEVNIIRFPGGSSNLVSKKYNKGIMTRLVKDVPKKGFYFFDWNVDSGDAAGNNVSVKTILNNIKTQSKGKNEICILMHDTKSKNTTVEALPYIISYLRSEGYRFEALTEESNGFHHKTLHN